jgi:hypothetical protein
MKLEQTKYDNSETGCCARLDTTLWEDRALEWKDKPFLRDHIRSFLHMPLDYGAVISRDHALVQMAGAYPEEPFWMTDEVSPWGADIYLAVDREIPGARIERLSGKFLTKVFEGPYRNAGKWAREMEAYVASKGETMNRLFFYYPNCPKCAKRFGKNQVVLLAQVR